MNSRHQRANFCESLERRLLMTSGELISNGAFEVAAASEWVRGSAWQAGPLGHTNYHGGAGYAYNGTSGGSYIHNTTGAAGEMYQQFAIPAGMTDATLTFWTKITTEETTTTTAYDTMAVQVQNSSGAVLQNLTTLSNLNAGSTSGPYTSSGKYALNSFSLGAYAGQTIRIDFKVVTDGTKGTMFRVDDVSVAPPPPVTPGTSAQIVGYMPYYRQSSFSNVDLNDVTYINYFSLSFDSTTGAVTNPSNISDASLATVVNAAHAKGIGVSITVGPKSFNTLAANATARGNFAVNIKNWIVARNLDGVDIDWESPALGINQVNYSLLIDDLYTQLHPLGKKITAAVNPWTKEIPVLATKKMDWVNVMCYDFDYANNSTYAAATDGMNQWLYYGVAKDKLVMGSPFYGRYGTSWSDTHSKTYSGILTDIKTLTGSYPSFDTDSYVDGAGNTVYFNGVTTMEKKTAFVRDNAYAGMMIWELGQDHWDANGKNDAWSLLPVINSILRPPSWVTPASGSRFVYLNNTFRLDFGSVTFNADAGASTSISTATGTSATFIASQKISSLTLAGNASLSTGGAKSLVVNTISLTGGQLNLNDNDMIVRSMSRASVEQLVKTGFGNFDWQGLGITSSLAASSGGSKSLGTVRAGDYGYTTFAGRTVSASDILVKYTWTGDANCDGIVDNDDMTQFLYGFNGGGSATWLNGDFDMNGFVDNDDFGMFIQGMNAFNASGATVL